MVVADDELLTTLCDLKANEGFIINGYLLNIHEFCINIMADVQPSITCMNIKSFINAMYHFSTTL